MFSSRGSLSGGDTAVWSSPAAVSASPLRRSLPVQAITSGVGDYFRCDPQQVLYSILITLICSTQLNSLPLTNKILPLQCCFYQLANCILVGKYFSPVIKDF